MKCLYFLGDSLTLGVNDPLLLGWTGRLGIKAQKLVSGSEDNFPQLTIYNLGVRKSSSRHIKDRWEAELSARLLEGAKNLAVFCFGTVDMAAPNGSVNVSVEESVENAREILTGAREKCDVLMISPPPVANSDHSGRICELNEAYRDLCCELGIPFYNMLPELTGSIEYMNDLSDGVHPGADGCTFFAERLVKFEFMKDWLRACA